MTAIAVDTVHARYRGVSPDRARRLDAALAALASHGLAEALLGRVDHPADHVCLREISISTAVDSSLAPDRITRTWADTVAGALHEAVSHAARAGGQLSTGSSHAASDASLAGALVDDGAGLVVYPRTADALVDLVLGVATGERTRLWAWRMVGLVDAHEDDRTFAPGPADVARALAAHPDLVPVVLSRTAALPRIPLTEAGWYQVAAAVGRMQRSPRTSATFSLPSRPNGPDSPAVPAPATPTSLGATGVALARMLPWRGADGDRLRDLAVLVLTCDLPSRVRDHAAVTAVAETWRHLSAVPVTVPDPVSDPVPDEHVPTRPDQPARTDAGHHQGHQGDRTGTGQRPRPGGDPDDARTALLAAPDSAAAVQSEVTRYGGLLLLMAPLRELDLVTTVGAATHVLAGVPAGLLLARLATVLSGAPLQDPAVHAFAGWHDQQDIPRPDMSASQEAAVVELAESVVAWLTERGLPDPTTEGDWLFRRRATIAREKGWIDVTFDLEDVDIRIRRAGLDLDPGFVWWLGSVVRFRYV